MSVNGQGLQPKSALEVPPIEALFFLLAVAAFLFGSILDWSVLHPGYVSYDDETLLSQVQAWREGSALPWGLGNGALFRASVALCTKLFGPGLTAVHVPALTFGLLELGLLAAWGARLGSTRAGVWAALLCLASANTWVRSRSLLSFSAVPTELMLALWVLPLRGQGWRRAALTGLGLSLLVLDYELWWGGLPGLLLFWFLDQRPRPLEAAAGFLAGIAGVALLAWASHFDLAPYAQVRMAHTAPLPGDGSLHRFVGMVFMVPSKSMFFSAAAGQAWAPRWFWPAALTGLVLLGFRRGLAWGGLLLLGLLPALARSPYAEPQRLLLAWPPLCLLAALGFDRWSGKSLWAQRLAPLLFLLALLPAWSAFQRSQTGSAALGYGASRNRLSAVQDLAHALGSRPAQVLADLDLNNALLLRFHLDASGIRPSPQGVVVVPVPWEFVPQGLPADWGQWVGSEGAVPELPGQYWLLDPQPARLKSWLADAALLKKFWPQFCLAHEERTRQRAAEAVLDAHPGPWARTIASTYWLSTCRILNEAPPARLKSILAGPLLGGQVQQEAAELIALKDPQAAIPVAAAACKADPRRLEAWQLWESLLRTAGRAAEADKVAAALQARLHGRR